MSKNGFGQKFFLTPKMAQNGQIWAKIDSFEPFGPFEIFSEFFTKLGIYTILMITNFWGWNLFNALCQECTISSFFGF